jgi:predicted DNA-binding transcriptional regulator YafY
LNRVDRLHAILVHLQGKRRVTAQELADRFNLSLRTVYRDIKALDESGVPVIGEAGIGYSVMEGYRLPPVMFTQEEASALLMGGKLIQQFTDQSVRNHFESALYKIKAVLRTTDKAHVEELENKIAVQFAPGISESREQPHLSPLRQAMVDTRLVRLDYFSASSEKGTTRDVEPIGLFYYGSAWHFIGWCRLRKDYRDFRLDRIKKLIVLDDHFDDKPHPTLTDYISKLAHDREMQEAFISFDKDIAKYMQSQKYHYGFVSQEEVDNRIRMRFLSADLTSLGRWLLMYTQAAHIESPVSLYAIMDKLLSDLNAHYKK